jgi:hypothetical protein
LDELRAALDQYKNDNDTIISQQNDNLTDHNDRISKLESELELLKSMGAPTDGSGSGDNSNLLGTLSEMLKKLEEKLSTKIIELDD